MYWVASFDSFYPFFRNLKNDFSKNEQLTKTVAWHLCLSCGVKSDFGLSRAGWSTVIPRREGPYVVSVSVWRWLELMMSEIPRKLIFFCLVWPRGFLVSSTVQQTPVCTHRTDQPLLQRRSVGVGGHSADLWQVPRKEGRPEGAVWERPSEFLLPHKVLGEFFQSWPLRRLALQVNRGVNNQR